jgi:purine-binding chemotaxis protein CheW
MATEQNLPGGHEVLTCTLGNEEYGIGLLKVQEIRGYDSVTRIANAPDCIKGVINLRGVIVPIVDMRIQFGLRSPIYDEFTVVIILNIAKRVVGIVVDRVSDVVSLTDEQIKPPPEMAAVMLADYLLGMAALEQRMVILIDIERLLCSSDIGLCDSLKS